MCSRCHKRLAVVYMTKYENGETKNEGLCLPCARALGIKPVDDILNKMGLSEEDVERLSGEVSEMTEGLIATDDEHEDGGAPPIDLPKLFKSFGMPMQANASNDDAKSETEPPQKKKKKDDKRKFLSTYCKDLTALAKEGKLDHIVGRDKELDRMIRILSRRQKNNPCLIGEPGVGKTAIAEALAIRIAEKNVPYKLRDAEVMLLDLTALVAGTQFRGQFESRVLGLIGEVKACGNIILVIDEVHNLVGTGDSEGSMSAANILKPALSRGEIQVIGATTLKEYRRYIEKDSALERRFQPLIVEEPTVEDTVDILRGIKKYYEQFHGIRISDDVVRQITLLSERYITDRFLPDKAIDLLDESAAKLVLSSPELTEKRLLDDEMRALGEEKERITAESAEGGEASEETYRKMADIKTRESQLNDRLCELEAKCESIMLDMNTVAEVLEIWTGIPASSIDAHEFERLVGLEKRLSSHVIGQNEAVDAVVRAIKRKRAGVSARKTPVSFIFAGPTGVGKTELVKTLAEDLFHKPDALIRLDMSEYMEKHAVSRIIGAPPGYVGYEEAGQLTEKVRRNPYCVVLFDEIEKAHPDVLNVLLQVLDEGHITDASGRRVNFENAIIVMTTNAGSDKSSAITGFTDHVQTVADAERTERALSEFLRPEFINRVDEIITFKRLDLDDFEKIAQLRLSEFANVLKESDIRFTYDASAASLIAKQSYSIKYGARNMQRYLRRHLEDAVAEKRIEAYQTGLTALHLSVDGDTLKIEGL